MTKTAQEFVNEYYQLETSKVELVNIESLIHCLEKYLEQIKLPNDEEIMKTCPIDYEEHLFWAGAKWMRDQIKKQLPEPPKE